MKTSRTSKTASRPLPRILVPAVALLLAAAVASAGTLYVMPARVGAIGDRTYETELVVSNPTQQALRFTVHEIAMDADGTQRPASAHSAPITVPPRATLVIDGLVDDDAGSMLEVAADEPLLVDARVRVRPSAGGRLGTSLPVVSSRNLRAAGNRYQVQGLQRGSGTSTAFGVVNLAHETSSCSFWVFGATGNQVLSVQMTLAPLSHRFYPDVLGVIGVPSASDVRVEVVCDRPSYAYAIVEGPQTGDFNLLEPSLSGASALTLPGGNAGGCPPGAFCFDLPDFTPTPGNAISVTELQGLPSGAVFDSVRVEMTFRHGGWHSTAYGLHGLFWLSLNDTSHANTFGYVNVRGPNRNLIAHLANVDLPPPLDPVRSTAGVELLPNRTYHLEYLYDGPSRLMRTVLRDASGAVIAQISDVAPTNRVRVQDGFTMQLALHRELVEVPTFGWQYQNVRVVFE